MVTISLTVIIVIFLLVCRMVDVTKYNLLYQNETKGYKPGDFFLYVVMYGAEQLLGGFWFLRQLFLATLLGWSIIKGVQITARHLPSMNYKYTVLTRGGMGDILLIINILSHEENIRIPFIMNKLTFLSTLFYISCYVFKLYFPPLHRWLLPMLFLVTFIGSLICPTDMLTMDSHRLLPYIVVALSGCLMILIFSEILSCTRIATLGDYIGKQTLTILTWHLLSFKLVTWIIILVKDSSAEALSAFPILLAEAREGWWMIYTLVGVGIPLLIKKMFRLNVKNKNVN